ncbi:Lactonase, 7-bladed beta-propeller-domain-containing protein [Aspergillus undulatus]|uniref:Lactonase, 7-bladed beta-propeller-domain-containing protein n=1 Tax=Aspergillus undulatus TaxID=1810928 RepID=UPI003CCE368F
MHLPLFTALLFGGSAIASRLYAASYDGEVTELGFSESGTNSRLTSLSQTAECGTSPSWLMQDEDNDILYCLDEGVDLPNGTLTSFKSTSNSSFAKVDQHQTISGPVSSAFYTPANAPNRHFFAVAHYSGSAVSTYSVDPKTGHFKLSQTFHFTISSPGPVPSRQDAPHPHGIFIDPTGNFVLVPDLGADVVRIFYIDPTTGALEQQQSLEVSPGSGPRHAVFWSPQDANPAKNCSVQTRFYLVTELDNLLRGYDVTYSKDGRSMFFSQFYEENTYDGETPPDGSKAAEIALSPDNAHLIISNRLDNTFGPGKDSLAVFSLLDSAQSHNVFFSGLYPAYGTSPRHFSISPDGDMLAIALQNNKTVVVSWDEENGAIGDLLGEVTLGGEVTAVLWDL